MRNFTVAIDGPAGSGKSSISKIVAKELGFIHIDTGAMYRAVTLEALRRGINLDDEKEYTFINDISVIYKDNKILLNGEDVSKEIRTADVTNNVSTPSKFKCVRDNMVRFQRESSNHGLILMDGRDIGTVVLPNANLKIFLTASAEERAKRRFSEIKDLNPDKTYEVILEEIKTRDYKDSNREISPLRVASDAITIDTSHMTIKEVVDKIKELINVRLRKMEDFKMEDLNLPKRLRVGEKVTGTVVSVEDRTIYLDIANFTEGTMHLDHYTNDKNVTSFVGLVKEGDEIQCEIAKVNEENIYLSRINQIKEESFLKLVDKMEENSTIVVTLKEEIKGKGFVGTYLGNRVFLPLSQAPVGAKVSDKIEVRIIDINTKNHNVVVSRKVIDNEIYTEGKEKEIESINVGDVLIGEVAKVEKFGAFIKFNFVQVLLRARDYDHVFTDLTQALHVGDKIEVKVISKENNKIAVSRKALLNTPFESYVLEHKVSDKVSGKIVNKLAFGLLVELAPNVRGLLHQSEYSHNPNDNFQNYCKIGDEIEVAIIAINTKDEKISLSRKALMDNPWDKVSASMGDLVTGTVKEVNEKGLVVETLGVEGYIPASETGVELKNSTLDSFFASGDEVKAYIIDIKPSEWRLRLSIRKYLNEEERKGFEKYLSNGEEETVTIGDRFKDILK